MKVHLVDGTYELFRSHFGAPSRKDAAGREVGATVGLLRSLWLLLSTPGVTHVACAFDHVIESFRNELYAGYKTSAGVAPDLLAQFELAEEAVRQLGVVVWPMVEFEADDALAAAAARFRDLPGRGPGRALLAGQGPRAGGGRRARRLLGPPPGRRAGRGGRGRQVRRPAGLDPRLAGAGR